MDCRDSMRTESSYSVVGVRAGGPRLIVTKGQSAADALALQQRLTEAGVFEEVVIEAVETASGSDTVDLNSRTIEM